jgi:hypothetical protein
MIDDIVFQNGFALIDLNQTFGTIQSISYGDVSVWLYLPRPDIIRII